MSSKSPYPGESRCGASAPDACRLREAGVDKKTCSTSIGGECFDDKGSKQDPYQSGQESKALASQQPIPLEEAWAPSSASSVEATRIHAAPDQYAVLSASQSSSEMHLRQSFLRTAVMVHPRANRSAASSDLGDANAFCKVASAWKELGDLGSRYGYDAELAAGRGQLTAEGAFVHRPPTMSVDNALSVFAFETWFLEQSGLQLPDDFSSILARAHQLVQEQDWKTSWMQQHATASDFIPDPVVTTNIGYPADLPGDQVDQSSGQTARGSTSSNRRHTDFSRCSNPLSKVLSDISMSCLPKHRPSGRFQQQHSDDENDDAESSESSSDIEDSDDADEEPSSLHDVRVIAAGDDVRLVGLQTAAMNGRVGQVVRPLPGPDNRFQVRLQPTAAAATPGPTLASVKKHNLQLLSQHPKTKCSSKTAAPISARQFL
eukprot:TRINITY_DN64275_c0_g1_i1.p1 TRINITY_DN64275_c0_g1~~TRINITY_DN64275_c0_g1_i1.p1  ORF type:complete len:432 (+),score=71.76 TRINITY_DN64275_c0_g1_i1:63-1358(+)